MATEVLLGPREPPGRVAGGEPAPPGAPASPLQRWTPSFRCRLECTRTACNGPDWATTEREGFEPSNEVTPVTRFPVAPVQPLRHLSGCLCADRGSAAVC